MKIDQIAWYCRTTEQAEALKAQLGLQDKEWVQDVVVARSIVNSVEGNNTAELQFNYSLGIELEILRYVDGLSWHNTNPLGSTALNRHVNSSPFLSHMGIHLEDGEEFPEMIGSRLVQETFTQSHTSDYLTNPKSPACGRKYHYRIFEISPGSYIKYIKRIHPKKAA